MEVFLIIAFIFVIILMGNEITKLKNQINFLDGKVRDLYDKSFYNYEQIKQLKKGKLTKSTGSKTPTFPKPPESVPVPSAAAKSHTAVTVTPVIPVPEKPLNPYRKPESAHVPAHSQSQQMPVITPLFKDEEPYTHSPTVNGNAAAKQMPPVKKPPNRPQFKSFENWLGTRLFNVVASLMIFIGLVLFCTLGYEYITDTMKMAAMFVVSSAFIALGTFFTRQNKSVFSLGLTGCGFGAFFISILLSHVYFHVLTDVAAFGLLLVWAIFALYMSKKLDSVMLSVTTHIGTAVSICFAFSLGFSAEKIILPVAYQMAAIAVIIIGNIFCCKKTYRFGLFMSELLLIYTSIVMCVTFGRDSVIPDMVSPVFSGIIFAVQLISISFVSYLISISTAALGTEEPKLKNLDDIIFLAHISNKILWALGIITTVGVASYLILKNGFGIDGLVYPTLAVCTATVAHFLVTLFMSEKLNFNEKLSNLSIWFTSIIVTIALFTQAAARDTLHGLPFVFVYIGFVMLVIRYTKNKALNHLAAFLIGCEMLYMIFYGYFAIENVVISIVYMVSVGVEILLHWFMQSGESRQRRFTFFKIAEYLWISVSIIPINVSEFSDISFPLILSEFALMNIIAYILKYAGRNEPELRMAVKIESILTVYISIFALLSNDIGGLGDILAIKIVFIILSASLTLLYMKDFVKSKSTALQVISAVTVSGFITAFCIGFADSLAIAYVYTNVLMCKPFFFITAIALSLIYLYNRNDSVKLFTWITIGIDAFLMVFFGYNGLCREYKDNLPLFIIAAAICIVHAVYVGMILYYTWRLQSEKQRAETLTPIKIVEYFWINFSAISICLGINANNRLSDEYIFAVLSIANIILFILEYHKSSKALERILKITSSVIMYISILFMSVEMRVPEASSGAFSMVCEYTVRMALILATVGLYYLISRELLKSPSVIIQAYIGLTATCIVNSACRGLSNVFEIAYIFSIVTMITALVCITVGFTSKTKGLRVYGLIVVMLCVIKLVTVDISATNANSMSRVVAFVVGGIVCFIISGIYNKVESKINS